MSALAAAPGGPERLLTFEVGGALYALPIAGVLEVVEAGPLVCIPGLPLEVAGVVNHHGDALPVLHFAALLELAAAPAAAPAQVLVVGARGARGGRLGLPVDRVLGLVDGRAAPARGTGPVVERRSLAGRVASLLDPARLVARAREVIERAAARTTA
jgi:chemotaxis signal transduction protein